VTTVVAGVEERASPTWLTGPPARISALVCTYRRPEFLPELLAALEGQELAADDFEVVVVDDGSGDRTWDLLTDAVDRTGLRMLVLRHLDNRGPAAARNLAASRARASILAITDDDCVPSPRWLAAMLGAFDGATSVVQGQVLPLPRDQATAGPWDHTIWVLRQSPFFETCNVAYRRDDFERVGGFDDTDELLTPEQGRGFGEDAELAWRVLSSGGRAAFADDALVHHRCVPADFRWWLRHQRHAAGFPGLARRSPLVSRWLWGRVFLTRRTAVFDLALTGAVAAALTRRWWLLVLVAPWLRLRWRDAAATCRGDRSKAAVVLGQHAVSDLVMFGSLVEGSIRHRRLVL
jgi:GT2 family glycosyltransferase